MYKLLLILLFVLFCFGCSQKNSEIGEAVYIVKNQETENE